MPGLEAKSIKAFACEEKGSDSGSRFRLRSPMFAPSKIDPRTNLVISSCSIQPCPHLSFKNVLNFTSADNSCSSQSCLQLHIKNVHKLLRRINCGHQLTKNALKLID